MKRVMKVAALLLAALLLGGCLPKVDLSQDTAALPTADLTQVSEAPLGYTPGVRSAEATIWYPGETGDRLVRQTFRVEGSNESQIYAAALQRMLVLGRGRFAEGAELLSAESTGDRLAVVEWRVTEDTGDRALFALLMSTVNTLGELGVEAVSFRVNGRAARVLGWPLGAVSPSGGDLTGLWARYMLENDEDECVRQALVYRAALDGGSIAPELVEVRLTREGEIRALLTALRETSGLSGAFAAFPSEESAVKGDPTWLGDGALRLTMDANLLAMLETETIRPWQMYACAACTLLAFLPEAETVEIFVGNARVGRIESPNEPLTFEDGAMRWEHFARIRSRAVTVYLAAGDRLAPVTRFMTGGAESNPLTRLSQVLSGPQLWETGAFRVVPDTVSAEDDILGVALEGQEARVNLSREFIEKCSGLTPQGERNLIYAMVDTLCGIRGVTRVRFYIDGETSETFLSQISLLSPLYYNEGMARSR